MNDVLDPQIQKQIIDILCQHPGISSSQIAKELHLTNSQVKTYLIQLQSSGEILSIRLKEEHCYYVRRRRESRQQRSQELRSKIKTLLLEHPGLNLTGVAEHLNMSVQLAEYHLINMERQNVVLAVKETGKYHRRYYVKESEVGIREKKILTVLRQEHLLRIVLLIMKYPNIYHKHLAQMLNITPGTLTHHLIRLEEYDLLEVTISGREKEYRIKQTREIMQLIRKYIFDIITERFHDIWDDLYIK